MHTTLTRSHFWEAVVLLSLSKPNILTPVLFVPLRLSNGVMNDDATSKTWNMTNDKALQCLEKGDKDIHLSKHTVRAAYI